MGRAAGRHALAACQPTTGNPQLSKTIRRCGMAEAFSCAQGPKYPHKSRECVDSKPHSILE